MKYQKFFINFSLISKPSQVVQLPQTLPYTKFVAFNS